MDMNNWTDQPYFLKAKWPSYSSGRALVRMETELLQSGVCDHLYLDELYESLFQRSARPDQDYYDCLVSMCNKNVDKLRKLWEAEDGDN